MLVFFTQGVGMYIGYAIVFGILYQVPSNLLFGITVDFSGLGEGVSGFLPLESAIKEARGTSDISFLQQLGQMFSVSMPAGVDKSVLTNAMSQWKAYWLLPAGMAGAIAVLFLVAFREKKSDTKDGK